MLGRKSLLILLSNAAGAVLAYAGIFFMARYMTPTVVGMVAVALAVAGVARAFTMLGLDSAHIKRVSEGRGLGACVTTYGTMKILLVFAVGTFVLTAALAWDALAGFHDATTLGIILIGLVFFAAAELQQIPVNTFHAFQEAAKAQIVMFMDHVARVPATIAVALAFGASTGRWVPFGSVSQQVAGWLRQDGAMSDETGAKLLMAAYAVGMIAALLVAMAIFVRHRYPIGRFDVSLARSYIAFALPLVPLLILARLAPEIDRLMLGYFWPSAEVGRYFQVHRLTLLALVLPNAIGTLFFPMMSALSAARDIAGVREVALTVQRILSLVMMIAASLMFFYAEEAIHILLSDAYLPAVGVLKLLAVHLFLVTFATIPTSILMGFNHPHAAAGIGIAGTLLNITLNFLFIPVSILGFRLLGLGAMGAALATLVAQGVMLAAQIVVVRRRVGVPTIPRSVAWHLGAALVVGLLSYPLRAHGLWGQLDRIHGLAAVGGASLALYVLILIALREVTRKDWLIVRDLLSPAKMRDYVRAELTPPERGQRPR